MTNNLRIFLIILCLLTFIFMYSMVKRKKILFKHAIVWSTLDIILLISVFMVDYLRPIADFIGIEKISNMIFLAGFIVVLIKNKINVLTQEVGLLGNKVRGMENGKNQKANLK